VKNLFPFVQASVGAGWIEASYKDHPNENATFTGGGIDMGERNNYNLVYSLGAGLKYLFNPHFQAQASYLYTDFGIIKTNTQHDGVTLSEPIKDHLYTNSALLTFSYLF
jgi:opacity protein-like surface antigen